MSEYRATSEQAKSFATYVELLRGPLPRETGSVSIYRDIAGFGDCAVRPLYKPLSPFFAKLLEVPPNTSVDVAIGGEIDLASGTLVAGSYFVSMEYDGLLRPTDTERRLLYAIHKGNPPLIDYQWEHRHNPVPAGGDLANYRVSATEAEELLDWLTYIHTQQIP